MQRFCRGYGQTKSVEQARENRPSGQTKGRRRVTGAWVISAVALRNLAGSFKDQARQVEGDGERVADSHGLGGVVQTEGAGSFELPASLGSVATFGVGLPANTQFPGFRAELGIARQAGAAIG